MRIAATPDRGRRARARDTSEAQRPECERGTAMGARRRRGRIRFRRAHSSNAKSAHSPHHPGTHFDSTIFHVAASRAADRANKTQLRRASLPRRRAIDSPIRDRAQVSRCAHTCGMKFHAKRSWVNRQIAQTRAAQPRHALWGERGVHRRRQLRRFGEWMQPRVDSHARGRARCAQPCGAPRASTTSERGGAPNRRLYSRENCEGLS